MICVDSKINQGQAAHPSSKRRKKANKRIQSQLRHVTAKQRFPQISKMGPPLGLLVASR